MFRVLILVLMMCGVALLLAPFVAASRDLDRQGVPITGEVFSKTETVRVHYEGWKRTSEISIEYWAPRASSAAFYNVALRPEQYDQFHKGQTVNLRYLRPEDTPNLPMAHFLREMHALPTVRLANRRMLSGVALAFQGGGMLPGVLAGIAAVLIFWRLSRLPRFAAAAGVCVLAAVAILLFYEFPRPAPQPVSDVRHGVGRVKSLDLVNRLFRGSRTRGIETAQPIEIVGVEFVPEGKTDTVLAVDLIDAGSVSGLKENAEVPVDYEAASPRTAYIGGASRGFVARNLTGVEFEVVSCVALIIGAFLLFNYFGGMWNRLLARR